MTQIFDGRELDTPQSQVRRGGAYTQTYATAARTVPAAVVALTAATDVSSETASVELAEITTTRSPATENKNLKSLQTKINEINADHLATKKVLNAMIDDHQAGNIFT